jgi:hypothetical protein
LAITKEKQEEHKILNGTVSLTPLEFTKNLKPMIEIWKDDDPRKNHDSMLSAFQKAGQEASSISPDITNKSFELFTRIEQAPNPASRITLDRDKDALGVPRGNASLGIDSI